MPVRGVVCGGAPVEHRSVLDMVFSVVFAADTQPDLVGQVTSEFPLVTSQFRTAIRELSHNVVCHSRQVSGVCVVGAVGGVVEATIRDGGVGVVATMREVWADLTDVQAFEMATKAGVSSTLDPDRGFGFVTVTQATAGGDLTVTVVSDGMVYRAADGKGEVSGHSGAEEPGVVATVRLEAVPLRAL